MKKNEMMMKAVVVGIVFCLAGLPPALAEEAKDGREGRILDELAAEALAKAPSLKQMTARINAEKTRAAQARVYPDPLLSVGLMNMPFRPAKFDASPMTGLHFTLTQVIPWPSKRSLAGKVAGREVEVTEEKLREAQLQLSAMVRLTALALGFLDIEERITKRHGDVLDRVVKVAEARYQVNKSLFQDVLKAGLERSSINDRVQEIAQNRESLEARLNALVGRDVSAEVARITLPGAPELKENADELIDRAIANRPLLAQQRKRIEVERLRRKEAEKGFLPDFGVNFTYVHRRDSGMDPVDGMDFWSIGVSIRVPLWSISAVRARIRQADAGIVQGQEGFRAALLEISRDIKASHDTLRRLETRIDIYKRQLLPQSRRVLQASMNDYTTGKVNFITVLDHQRSLLKYEIDLWRMEVSRLQQWETLRAAVGGDTLQRSGDRE